MASSSAPTSASESSRDLECPVCQEQYKDPRILPCGHTLCLKPCLEQMAGAKLKCPECRMEHEVPTNGLDGFLKNVAISRMLTVRPKEKYDKPKISSCPICNEDDELRKCGHCHSYTCYGCLTEHMPLYKQTLKDRAQQILVQHDKASSNVKTSEQEISQSVNQKADESISTIDTAAASAVTLIEDKVKELKAAVESARQEELNQVTEMSEAMESSLTSAVDYSKEIIEQLRKKENILPVKLDRISAKLSENAITQNKDLKSLVIQKNIDIDLNISGLETALRETVVIRRPLLDQKQIDVEANRLSSPSNYQPGRTSAGASKVLEKDFSQVKMVFGSATTSHQLNSPRPRAVAIDPNSGDVVVTYTWTNSVKRYDSTGKLIFCFGKDQFSNLDMGGLVINGQSQMIISDTENKRIRIYNKDGSHCRDIDPKCLCSPRNYGSEVKQFSSPCDVALDVRGNIHVCDKGNGRIHVFKQDGTFFCQYQPAGCTQPEHICITSDGTICICDKHECIILNAYFQCISKWKIFERTYDSVKGMCVCDDDRIMISHSQESTTNQVTVFDIEGQCLKEIAYNHNIVQFRSPLGIAVDKHGDVYMACCNVVLKF